MPVVDAEHGEIEVVVDGQAAEQARGLERAREPRRARLRAGSAVTSPPNSSTVPAVGGNSPEIRLNSVVLPAPFGPRIARRSPGGRPGRRPATATTPPKRRPTPRKRRIGAALQRMPQVRPSCPSLRRTDLLGVADPRRRRALLALRVLAVRRRRVGGRTPPNVWSTSGMRRTSGRPARRRRSCRRRSSSRTRSRSPGGCRRA